MKSFDLVQSRNLLIGLLFTALVFLNPQIVLPAKAMNEGSVLINSISGQAFDPYNRPIDDLDVELMNDNSSTVVRTKTRGSGRFSFSGIPGGNYKVTVYTLGTVYLSQTQDVQIVNLVANSSDQQYIDFYLKFDPRKINTNNDRVPEEVFVQEGISKEAKRHFTIGIRLLDDKTQADKGLKEITTAIQISPDYYDALIRLGTEYVQRKEFEKSLPYLVKALDINPRSYGAFYNLGYSCYLLHEIPEAVEAFRGATTINSGSANAQLFYGTVLRLSGDFDKSEKALLRSKNLNQKTLPQVYYQLALLYNRMGRNKEAADQLETYLLVQPDPADKKDIQALIVRLRNSGN